jgi:hypothetical protein
MKFEDSGHHLLINSKFVFALELFGLKPLLGDLLIATLLKSSGHGFAAGFEPWT